MYRCVKEVVQLLKENGKMERKINCFYKSMYTTRGQMFTVYNKSSLGLNDPLGHTSGPTKKPPKK